MKDIKNLYRLKTEAIHKKYYKNLDSSNNEEDIIRLMYLYIENLKEINLIYTRTDIEELKYNETKFPETLFNNDMKNKYCFFGIVLGFLDGNIDFLDNKIFKDSVNDNMKLTILYFRNNVINTFNDYISIADCNILKDTILTIPCYKNFNNCLEKLTTCKCNKLLELDLMKSYLIGYKNYNKHSLYKVYYTCLNLIQELNNFKKENENKVNKLRVKKKII